EAWAGWGAAPAALRAAAILLVPMLAPLALLTIVSALGGRAAPAAGVVAGAGVGSGFTVWLGREPFLDRDCWRDWPAHPFAPFAGAEIARTATNIELLVGAVCGTVAVVVCAGALARSFAWPAAAGVPVGCALAASSLVLRFEPTEDPTRPLYGSLFAAR